MMIILAAKVVRKLNSLEFLWVYVHSVGFYEANIIEFPLQVNESTCVYMGTAGLSPHILMLHWYSAVSLTKTRRYFRVVDGSNLQDTSRFEVVLTIK